MIEAAINRFQTLIPNETLKKVLLHAAFWCVWLSRSMFDIINLFGLKYSLLFISITFLTQAPLVYTHLYFYVPKFLNRKIHLVYFVLTAVSIFAYSYLNYGLLQLLPQKGMPERLIRYLEIIEPNYDILEGLIVVLLTYSLKYTLIAFITQNELLRLQKEKLQLELNSLKAQVHPHFLFNTLNNLYSLTLKNSNKASEVVLKLSDIMRYVLYQANEDQVELAQEISFINDYIDLQRIRYASKYTIDFEVIGITKDKKIAPLLFIDFVENAFKHGLDKRFNDGYVTVKFTILDNEVIFECNNSLGQTEDNNTSHKTGGKGHINVQRRLELIYPNTHTLAINKNIDSYTVYLKIML